MRRWVFVGLCICLRSHAAVYNVRDFGAKGDGMTFDTLAIQKALNACEAAGGMVEFPPGIYLCQPLKLYSKTILKLDPAATLRASTNQADFMKAPGDWLKARGNDFLPLISGKDLTDIRLTGGGIIDGGGAAWWPAAENARRIRPGYTLPRPNLISLERCTGVQLDNLMLQNSPKYHFVPADCDNVLISNVTILAPEHAANTDAIDPSGHHILITHCTLDVGDDNVAIKAGKRGAGRDFESENITITECTILHGHGISIGSETAGGVRNVTVKNCTFRDTENGLRIKSDTRRGGLVEDIVYENITMTNVNPAITFTCHYQQNSAGDPQSSGVAASGQTVSGERTPVYRNIRITNLVATCPKAAGLIDGLPESCISNVMLENVKISSAMPFQIRNAKSVKMTNVLVAANAGKPFLLENADVSGMANP